MAPPMKRLRYDDLSSVSNKFMKTETKMKTCALEEFTGMFSTLF